MQCLAAQPDAKGRTPGISVLLEFVGRGGVRGLGGNSSPLQLPALLQLFDPAGHQKAC